MSVSSLLPVGYGIIEINSARGSEGVRTAGSIIDIDSQRIDTVRRTGRSRHHNDASNLTVLAATGVRNKPGIYKMDHLIGGEETRSNPRYDTYRGKEPGNNAVFSDDEYKIR